MARVRNLGTGLAWDVPAGHYALTSGEYEVLPEPQPEPEPALVAEPEPGPAKRLVARKNARKE